MTTEPRDPEEVAAAAAPVAADIAPETRMGAVHLSVADLGRSIDFYMSALGLQVHAREDDRVLLGTGGEDLLVLIEEPGAQPARRRSGLYHFALLLPQRIHLARWLAHAARTQTPLTGLSDHFVSEAIYLNDPDEHGIEIYWDRPREVWEGKVAERLTTLPLDTRSLLGELDDPASEPFDGLAEGTVMGHVHLRVAAIPATVSFYCDVLGFALMASLPTAAFLAAGGYHHHLGANTWESAGADQAPPGHATLKQATIVVPGDGEVDRLAAAVADAGQEPEPLDGGGVLVRDPSGNPLALRAQAARA